LKYKKKMQSNRAKQALSVNINAAVSLQNILGSNLGPRGTLKMLVSGAGDIKLTKDGNILLHEMQISHPTAALIARVATGQDDITGDGTTSTIVLIGELLSQSARFIDQGMHSSTLAEGLELARDEAKKFLAGFKEKFRVGTDKELLLSVARTALRTKLPSELADKLAGIVLEAVNIVQVGGDAVSGLEKKIDLHMVEIQTMEHRLETDTELVRGLVLDHGPRHPDMKTRLKNCLVLTCNISMEYEKSEVNSQFTVSDPKKRQEYIEAERRVVDDRVREVISLKQRVCSGRNSSMDFLVVNQKGIDPMSLDMLAKAGITALRRAKKRNMERLTLACGGQALNSLDNIQQSIQQDEAADNIPQILGYASDVHEEVVGEEKYTFVEGCRNPHSCTILIRAPNKHTINQIKDAVRDGLRAVKNALEDDCVLPGAGAVEVALADHLTKFAKTAVKGKASVGVQCFAEALLVIPKTLAANSGLDPLEALLAMQQAYNTTGMLTGLDIWTGGTLDPVQSGIFDNWKVKEHTLETSTFTAAQLLFVDEIYAAGGGKKHSEQ